MYRILTVPTALLIFFAPAFAAAPKDAKDTKEAKKAAVKKADPAFDKVVDDPKLPRVLLIGDSISIGYTPDVRKLLAGKANVHRIMENGGPTLNGTAKVDKWLGEGKWDVIHFNFGLHDLKIDAAGKHQIEPDAYEKNLRDIVKKLKATGAKVIFGNTTPVPEGKLNPIRKPADVEAYNKVAAKVMEENGVAVNDLYAAALPKLSEIQLPVNVHFKPAGSKFLAEKVAAVIEAALKK